MRYGYARVSTEDQSLEIQIVELRAAGCEDVRFEKVSGGSIDKRDEFTRLLREIQAGDELWVVRIDRFARSLRDLGVACADPAPSDTLFHPEARAKYDAVICMYHDQALIPVKLLDFWGGVNITLGLPIVRTSPDHGVGYDIAGRGLARADSLIAAVKTAAEIAERRLTLSRAT